MLAGLGAAVVGCARAQDPDDSCFGYAVLVDPSTIERLAVGDSVQLTARLNDALPCLYHGVRAARFEWTARPAGVVQLRVVSDSTVSVRAVEIGETVLVATGNDDPGLSALMNVKVVRPD